MTQEFKNPEMGWANPVMENDSNEPLISENEKDNAFEDSFHSIDIFSSRKDLKNDLPPEDDSQPIIPKTSKKKNSNDSKLKMRNYLIEKKKRLEQEDKLARFKFKPNCFSKYYALCCLNCDKLTKNYIQTICQQLLLPCLLHFFSKSKKFCISQLFYLK